jgi:hypothetical protein
MSGDNPDLGRWALHWRPVKAKGKKKLRLHHVGARLQAASQLAELPRYLAMAAQVRADAQPAAAAPPARSCCAAPPAAAAARCPPPAARRALPAVPPAGERAAARRVAPVPARPGAAGRQHGDGAAGRGPARRDRPRLPQRAGRCAAARRAAAAAVRCGPARRQLLANQRARSCACARRQPRLSGPAGEGLTQLLASREAAFEAAFTSRFAPQQLPPSVARLARAALSNTVGSMGYFYGRSRVQLGDEVGLGRVLLILAVLAGHRRQVARLLPSS